MTEFPSMGASPANLANPCPVCDRPKDHVCLINGKNDFTLVHPERFELAHSYLPPVVTASPSVEVEVPVEPEPVDLAAENERLRAELAALKGESA